MMQPLPNRKKHHCYSTSVCVCVFHHINREIASFSFAFEFLWRETLLMASSCLLLVSPTRNEISHCLKQSYCQKGAPLAGPMLGSHSQIA